MNIHRIWTWCLLHQKKHCQNSKNLGVKTTDTQYN